MKNLLIPMAAIALFLCAGQLQAQEKSAAPLPPPVPEATCAPECPPPCCEPPCRKVACPGTEKHSCISYDCKEEDYAYTCGAHFPILSRFCRNCCGCGGSDDCNKCGTPHTRKVLIKIIRTEEVPSPKCRVERVPVCTQPACPEPTTEELTKGVKPLADEKPEVPKK